jgi:hypothetical protein
LLFFARQNEKQKITAAPIESAYKSAYAKQVRRGLFSRFQISASGGKPKQKHIS